jgi:hypothetical protein
VELLTCTKCGEAKDATATFFPKNSRKTNGLDSWCKQCRSDYRKATRMPPGVSDVVSFADARQIRECIICGETQSIQLAIDHNHKTGEVRGALCSRCNLGLGHFRDDPELLRFAALYLEGRCACGECTPRWGGSSLRAWKC